MQVYSSFSSRRLGSSDPTSPLMKSAHSQREHKSICRWIKYSLVSSITRSYSYGDASPRPANCKLMALQSDRPARLCVPMLHALIAAIAPFSVGVWWAWAAQTVLNASQNPTERAWSWSVLQREIPWTLFVLNLGVCLGCWPVGYSVNRYGRKWTLLSTGFLHLLSWLVVLSADKRSANLYSGRMLAGLAAAVCGIAYPIYVAEISSVHIGRFRGTAISLGGIATASGALIGHIASPIASYGSFAAVACIPPAIFIVAFFNSPESPFQLAAVGRIKQAALAVRRLRGTVADGTNLIGQSGQSTSQTEIEPEEDEEMWVSWKGVAFDPELRFNAFLAILAMTLPRLAGSEIILTFAAEQLPHINSSDVSWPRTSQDLIVGIYAIIVVASVISTLLVDWFGRRPLITSSAVVAALAMCSMGTYHVIIDVNQIPVTNEMRSWLVASLFIWAGAFGLGLLSVPTIIAIEVLTTNARGLCTAVALLTAVLSNMIMTPAFQAASAHAGLWAVYFTFAVFYAFTAAYGVFFVPEMKARPMST